MRRLTTFVCAGVALAALTLAPQAAGESHTFRSDSLIGNIGGTNGYTIHLFGYRKHVIVEAGLGNASTEYLARGVATKRRIAADLGEFGSVDLAFEPKGKVRHPPIHGVPRGCDATLSVQPGVLTGTLSFQARNGLTAAESSEVDAKVVHSEYRCNPEAEVGGGHHHPHHNEGHHAVFLDARNSQGEFGAGFSAIQVEGRKRVLFNADISERSGGVKIYSGVSAQAPKSSFTFDGRKETATVKPPPPFTGSAELGHAPDGVPTWTGDLAVDIPGYGPLALTGDSFQASLATGSVIGYGGGGWYRSRLFSPPSAGR